MFPLKWLSVSLGASSITGSSFVHAWIFWSLSLLEFYLNNWGDFEYKKPLLISKCSDNYPLPSSDTFKIFLINWDSCFLLTIVCECWGRKKENRLMVLCGDWIHYNGKGKQVVYKTQGPALGRRGAALKVESLCVARQLKDRQDSSDAGWLSLVGSDIMPFSPHEAHHCGACEGCCVELSSGNLPVRRKGGIDRKWHHTVKHTLRRGMLCK